MKIFVLIIATVAAIILWWPRPVSFSARWPEALPPAMSMEMINRARKASQHPAFCPYPWWDPCRIG